MTRDEELAILDRLIAHRAAGTADMAPTDRVIPADDYRTETRFAQEIHSLYRRLPLVLAPSSELPRPGDFLTSDDYGLPVLVTRDAAGIVQAFLNACTHRGARLVSDAMGCGQKAFSCPYHGWTFGNDGTLLHITHGECFPGMDKAGHDLVRLPVQERFGLIWIVLDPQGTIDVDGYLGALAAEIDGLQIAKTVTFRPHERAFAGNWKLFQENFLESYHLHYTHSTMVTDVRDDGMLVDPFGPHTRFIGPRVSLDTLAHVGRHRWRLRPCAYFTYFIFPNTCLSADPDRLLWQRVYPDAVGHSRIVQTLLVPELAQGEHWQPIWEAIRARNSEALEEDMRIVETIPATLEAGLLPGFRFGRREPAILAFHDAIAKTLSDPPDQQAQSPDCLNMG
jgi:phenylpropionate dioxygenase-like ring-hydroxylating dioxygenase large terminal subunit